MICALEACRFATARRADAPITERDILDAMTNRWSPAMLLFGAVIVVASAALATVLMAKGHGNAAQPRAGCGRAGDTVPCKILFVGNSYTYVNDLPVLFGRLARSGHHLVQAELVAGAGESLIGHLAARDVMRSLRSTSWNVVVLQEQSQIPANEHLRQTQMYPAARQLVGMIRTAQAQPMFFLTWARRDGWPANGLLGYETMQAAVDDGYLAIARDLHVAVAPVGNTWSTTLSEERHADRHAGLWKLDGSHPTVKGTYLAACVFYAAIFREAPDGLSYHAGLPVAEAARIQSTASQVVLGDPEQWGLR